MKLSFCLPHLCLIAMLSTAVAQEAVEQSGRQESLGDLYRFDPAPETLPGLLKRYGNARRGVPIASERSIQRIGDLDRWCVELGSHLAVMGLNKKTGQPETLAAIKVDFEWRLSRDGKRLVAGRYDGKRAVFECFDFQSGKSLWTFENGMDEVVDVIFTQDGKHVVVLHPREEKSAVTWLDAANGNFVRRVEVPGKIMVVGGPIATDYLGETAKAIYVAVPEHEAFEAVSPAAWRIPHGTKEAVKVELDPTPSRGMGQITVGGAKRELIAIHTGSVVELFREEQEGLKLIIKLDEYTSENLVARTNHVAFSPDHSQMLVSNCEYSWTLDLKKTPKPAVKEYERGWPVGDYTRDGKNFVAVDDGGGALLDLKQFERTDKAELQENPEHCCPIEEAGFSLQGDYTFSNDDRNLILWTKKGDMVAELTSPNAGKELRMQSPILIEKTGKIYAADGWDFLEWTLDDINNRRKRLPGFNPRVEGKPVFRDGKGANSGSRLMTVYVDKAGRNLVTGNGSSFIFRPLEDPAQRIEMQSPGRDIVMRPRIVQTLEEGKKLYVLAASDLFELDPTGKKEATRVGLSVNGFDAKRGRAFRIDSFQDDPEVQCLEFGMEQKVVERMKLPPTWKQLFDARLLVSDDGRWLVVCRGQKVGIASLSVIDWENKKVIKEVTLYAKATALSFSPDEKRILVGLHNRSVCEFDFEFLKK